MPQIKADIVEVFVVRWRNGRFETLLGERQALQGLGRMWQPFSVRLDSSEPTIEAAKRAVSGSAGMRVAELYSSDRMHQFFDHQRDVVVIAPVLAATVHATAAKAGVDFSQVEWCDAPTARTRLALAGHRDALDRIVELLGPGGADIELYRLI